MEYKIKYIAQLCNKETDEVLDEQLVQTKILKFPKTFKEFGLRHAEQIMLIKASQDFTLKHQLHYFDEKNECLNCGKKLRKQGAIESDFHDVLTDHKIHIRRLTCMCGWKNQNTINGIYGNASHPELLKLQTKMGAEMSFDKASQLLNAMSCEIRNINNDVTIMRNVTKVGELLDIYKKSKDWCETEEKSGELIVVTDGGHVQNKEEGKHTFEEMVSTVYRPEDVVHNEYGRTEITNKLCVASAKSDKQYSIKKLTLNACKKAGLSLETTLTALTDGASNCWSVINTLESDCKEVIKILDWFHLGKKFKEREFKIPEELKEKYNKAKWHCWHGHPITSIVKLNQIKRKLNDKRAIEKLEELICYITNNQEYIINYHARRLKQLPFTSQLAETSVNSVINERQKNKKMQWTRKGAHNILQLRTSLYSKQWNSDWEKVESELYKMAA